MHRDYLDRTSVGRKILNIEIKLILFALYVGLLVLFVVFVIGIIFRDKLRSLWFNIKSKFGGGKGGREPPGHGPPPGFPGGIPPHYPTQHRPIMRPMPERRIIPHQEPPRQPPQKPTRTGASKELDEVLKKLKEMGK